MGILNVTPDSFSDGGLFDLREAAVAHAHAMTAEGADIIDIGGESTRPGYTPVSADDEIARVVPIIEAIAATSPPISIDTYKAATAEAALKAGAKIVNDIWGLQRDPAIASVAASHGAPVIVMHNRETPDESADIIDEMRRFFDRSLEIAARAGIPDGDIILDPGIGFGKTRTQELDALRRMTELKAFGFPVLVGASRKSFIGRIAATTSAAPLPPHERINGTLAAHILAIGGGADIVRAHDVRAHVEAARVADAILAGAAHP
jgi:dihydropteroate synthase